MKKTKSSCDDCKGTGKVPCITLPHQPARSTTCSKCSGTGFKAADESGPTPTTGGDTGE